MTSRNYNKYCLLDKVSLKSKHDDIYSIIGIKIEDGKVFYNLKNEKGYKNLQAISESSLVLVDDFERVQTLFRLGDAVILNNVVSQEKCNKLYFSYHMLFAGIKFIDGLYCTFDDKNNLSLVSYTIEGIHGLKFEQEMLCLSKDYIKEVDDKFEKGQAVYLRDNLIEGKFYEQFRFIPEMKYPKELTVKRCYENFFEVNENNYKYSYSMVKVKKQTKNLENEESKVEVENPSHYQNGFYETIDEMLIVFGAEATFNYCVLNAWKYRARANYKGNKEADLEKANTYLKFAHKIVEENSLNKIELLYDYKESN